MGHKLMEACKDMERSEEEAGRRRRGSKKHWFDWQKYMR